MTDKDVVRYAPGERDTRPWGEWLVLDIGPGFTVKRIRVTPGGKLSLQRHRHRSEQWIIVAGLARVTVDDRVFDLTQGQGAQIPLGAIHRVENPGTVDMEFIEVQTGSLLDENDIERLEDSYGRA